MLTADFYIRVSTDEQAERGFSQRYQEEVLRKYCECNNIKIGNVVFEDYSAKNFNRPEWRVLLKSYHQKKNTNPNLLLFTKWDRFSRNIGDAYYMIHELQSLGIEARAIEQPIDLSIPENLVMLALCLAMPEAENARRALNVKQGMQRAKREGQYMGKAPVGYENCITNNRIKFIAPVEPMASIMRMAFEKIATRAYSVIDVYRKAVEHGLDRKVSSFYQAIRNPVYCGKVLVNATDGKVVHYIIGKHEPIVSEDLFNKVQKIIERKVGKRDLISVHNDSFPLRGLLVCPVCGRKMTGSTSRGRRRTYSYYHCTNRCPSRFRTDLVHNCLLKELKTFVVKPYWYPLLNNMLKKAVNDALSRDALSSKIVFKKIEDLHLRSRKARELLLQGFIEGEDYKNIRNECEAEVSILGRKLHCLQSCTNNIQHDVELYFKMFSRLDELYQGLSAIMKREFLLHVFDKAIIFNGVSFYATNLSYAVGVIFNETKVICGIKDEIDNRIENKEAFLSCDFPDELDAIIGRAKVQGLCISSVQAKSILVFVNFMVLRISEKTVVDDDFS